MIDLCTSPSRRSNLGKVLKLSVPQFPHVQDGDESIVPHMVSRITYTLTHMHKSGLTQYLSQLLKKKTCFHSHPLK
jgi:hypothetical protein